MLGFRNRHVQRLGVDPPELVHRLGDSQICQNGFFRVGVGLDDVSQKCLANALERSRIHHVSGGFDVAREKCPHVDPGIALRILAELRERNRRHAE